MTSSLKYLFDLSVESVWLSFGRRDCLSISLYLLSSLNACDDDSLLCPVVTVGAQLLLLLS